MNRRTSSRAVLAVVVLGLVLSLAAGFVTAGQSPNQRYDRSAGVAPTAQEQVVEPRSGVTVITAQRGDMRDLSGEIVAFRPDGTVLYQSERYSTYWDVDPSPRGDRTVTYVATEWLNKSVCGGGPMLADRGNCRRNVVERLNLTTGERTRLYSYRMEGAGGTTLTLSTTPTSSSGTSPTKRCSSSTPRRASVSGRGPPRANCR
ncbi:hypothetical protein [Halorussus caseinilyticus]|uniref:Uncharacterized protein n=1 Tax=Halorussus caseinilyticus TaxID=3034025 RepID=A0ABD5WLQ9_9EURY